MNRREVIAIMLAALVVIAGTAVAIAVGNRDPSDRDIATANSINRSRVVVREAAPAASAAASTTSTTAVTRLTTRRAFRTFTTPDGKYQMLVPGPMSAASDLGAPGSATATIDEIRYTFSLWKRPENVSDQNVMRLFADQQALSAGATMRNPRGFSPPGGQTYDLELVRTGTLIRYHSKLVGQEIAVARRE